MSTITAPRPAVKSIRILYDATLRHPAPRDFAKGIFRSLPTYRTPCTDADAVWAAQTYGEISDRRDAALDREMDFRAAEVAAIDAIERGLIPPDVADYISRTGLVGHPA